MAVAEQAPGKLIGGQPKGRDVHPYKVSTLEASDAQLRQFLRQVFLQAVVIAEDIFVERIEPVLTFIIGGFKGDGTEGVDIANLKDVYNTVDAATPLVIPTNDVGYLQTYGAQNEAYK